MEYPKLKEELKEIAKIVHEFPDNVKESAFSLLIQSLLGQDVPSAMEKNPKPIAPAANLKTPKGEKKDAFGADDTKAKPKKGAKKTPPKFVKDLDLRGNSKGVPSFKQFVSDKNPKSNIEFTTCSIYYLTKLAGISAVSVDHIYTCYKEFPERKMPTNFDQNIWDTSSRKFGYIDGANGVDLKLSLAGENLVDSELAKRPK